MKNYIYKIIIFIIATIIIFEFTIGKHINQFNEKLNTLQREGRKEMVSSLKKELEKLMKKKIILMSMRDFF